MMVDAGQVVLKLHQQASTLADCALLTKHNELVAAARKLARTINQLVIADRPLSQALLTLYSKDHQPSAQWTVKLGTLTALLCHQLGYLESVSETLVRAAITMDLSVIDTLNARFKSQPLSNDMKQRWLKHPILSAQLLKRSGVQDPLWLTLVLQHHESPNGKGYPNSLPQSQLLSSSILLGFASDSLELLMPTAKRHGILPDTVLQRCYFRRGCYLKAHIQALADIFSPLATGTQLKLQGGGLAIVLRKPVKDYVWAALPISRPQQKAADVVKLEKPEVDRVFPMLKIGSPNTLSTWLDGHQQMSNSQKYCWLDPTPQPSPLKIQLNRLLSEEQPNITKISQYIASEPLLIDALTEMANRQTKTAKATKEIKHAIMMMGLDRLGPILMRTDLLQQCMQRRFPLDRWAYQYINLYAECCAQLASQSYFMMPEQARTLATFAAIGWLFDKKLQTKVQLNERFAQQDELTSLFELLTSSPHQQVALYGVGLAKHWQLDPSHLIALETFAELNLPEDIPLKARHPYYLLAMASHLMMALLGKNSSWQERTALMTRIDISQEQYQAAQQAVLACGCVQSPLHLVN